MSSEAKRKYVRNCNLKPSVSCERTPDLWKDCRAPSCDIFDRDPFFSMFGYIDPRKEVKV